MTDVIHTEVKKLARLLAEHGRLTSQIDAAIDRDEWKRVEQMQEMRAQVDSDMRAVNRRMVALLGVLP